MKMATGCSREKPRVKNSKDWGSRSGSASNELWEIWQVRVSTLLYFPSQEIRIMLALFVLCVVVMLKQK